MQTVQIIDLFTVIMSPFNAELKTLPVTGYFLGFVKVFVVVNAFPCSLCILCARVPETINKRQFFFFFFFCQYLSFLRIRRLTTRVCTHRKIHRYKNTSMS